MFHPQVTCRADWPLNIKLPAYLPAPPGTMAPHFKRPLPTYLHSHPSVSAVTCYITGCPSPLTPPCLPSLVTSQDVPAPSPLRVWPHWLLHRMSQLPHPSVSGLIGYTTECPSSLIPSCLSSLVTSQDVPAPSPLRVCHHWLHHRLSQPPHPSVSVIIG